MLFSREGPCTMKKTSHIVDDKVSAGPLFIHPNKDVKQLKPELSKNGQSGSNGNTKIGVDSFPFSRLLVVWISIELYLPTLKQDGISSEAVAYAWTESHGKGSDE